MKNEQTKPFWRVFTAGAVVLLTLLGGWKAIGMPASEIPTNTFSAASLQVVIRGELTAAANESLVMAQLKEGLYALLFFEFCVLFAAAVLSVWAAMRKTLQKRMLRQMHALAVLVLDAGVWVLTDSNLLALVTDKVVLVSFLSLVSFGLLAPLTIQFIQFALRERQPALRWMQGIALILLSVNVLGWCFGGVPMFGLLIPMHIVMLVSMVLGVRATWHEYRQDADKELRDILAAFVSLVLCSVAALALFYLQIGRSYAKAYCVGLLLFLVLLGWAMARRTQRDLNDRYQLETYKKLAYLDALTGLSNYAAFKNHQQQWETRQDWGYIMLDVNGLKEANDTFGHAAGDELIQGAARCIQEAFYHADGCYRVGGDEFAVVWSGVDEAVVRRAVDRFRNLCREQNAHAEYPVSVAVGYALQKDRTLTSDELLHEADARMYRNKARIKAVMKKAPR